MTHAPALADRDQLAAIAEQGRALILSLQDASGAYPASPTFSAYRGYSWFRDGAFIADAMSAVGERDSASSFFDWCARMLTDRAAEVRRIVAAADAGTPVGDTDMLPTRFTLDGREGDDDWWDFQLDGYGLWLWALAEHVRRHDLDPTPWLPAVELTIDYLASSWHRPCYDWWEEHVDQHHISTLGCIAAGLRAVDSWTTLDASAAATAAETAATVDGFIRAEGIRDGHLVKWVGSDAVDASLASLIAPLNLIDATTPLGAATLAELDRQLVVDGGMHRFVADTYYGGGQWPLLSCFQGLAWLRAGERDRAVELLRWTAGTVRESGTMPEQVADHLNDPTMVSEWIDRWGTSADPLLWSYAMYLRLALELGVVDQ
ncbi:glycoside hydrolase family 15 protein [uncultured Schumannella sp.]|uniref:glycoside hydrolase family 15 protein n=1 Tax=uncultured Schumannella sp. TaxID=1195956 RepID=UPI0025D30F46|nr:glycoside hydrolase family 15 protein [uncultured Schumannella sp.]